MNILEGKVAIVTGGGRGLGRAHALRFAEEGCRVVVNDLGCDPHGDGRDASVAAGVVAEIEARGGQALASDDDVSRPDEVERLVQAAIDRFGKVDILVTSAAIFRDAPILEVSPGLWDPVTDVNLRGTFLCVRAVARHLAARGEGGRILTTTSLAGLRGSPGLPIYSAAKAGIYGLTISVAQELRSAGITVNTLSPIAFTRVTTEAMKDIPGAAVALAPTFVADVALFLVSDLAAGITGAVVEVQGQQVSVSRMLQSEGVMPSQGDRWTPNELGARWAEITNVAPAAVSGEVRVARTG